MNRHSSSSFSTVVLIAAVSGLLSGCITFQSSSLPRIIAPENRLSIEKVLSGKTVWPGDELRIEFTSTLKDANLELKGKIFLTGGIQYFNTITDMRVELFFTNDDGHLVGRSLLYSAGYRVPADEWGLTFHKRLTLPEGATQVAFGYDGRVQEGGGGSFGNSENGGTDYTFWYSPLK